MIEQHLSRAVIGREDVFIDVRADATQEGRESHAASAIAEGRMPADIAAARLVRNLPTGWAEQEKALGSRGP